MDQYGWHNVAWILYPSFAVIIDDIYNPIFLSLFGNHQSDAGHLLYEIPQFPGSGLFRGRCFRRQGDYRGRPSVLHYGHAAGVGGHDAAKGNQACDIEFSCGTRDAADHVFQYIHCHFTIHS